jgi:hypothetical protein
MGEILMGVSLKELHRLLWGGEELTLMGVEVVVVDTDKHVALVE